MTLIKKVIKIIKKIKKKLSCVQKELTLIEPKISRRAEFFNYYDSSSEDSKRSRSL